MIYTFSSTGIDNYLEDLLFETEKICGNCRLSKSVCGALCWYVQTDRATIDFVKKMLDAAPAKLAKVCLKGGSDDEIIRNIKKYLKVAD